MVDRAFVAVGWLGRPQQTKSDQGIEHVRQVNDLVGGYAWTALAGASVQPKAIGWMSHCWVEL